MLVPTSTGGVPTSSGQQSELIGLPKKSHNTYSTTDPPTAIELQNVMIQITFCWNNRRYPRIRYELRVVKWIPSGLLGAQGRHKIRVKTDQATDGQHI